MQNSRAEAAVDWLADRYIRVEEQSLKPADLAKMLLIIPCSGAKRDFVNAGEAGVAITQRLPVELASELLEARKYAKERTQIDETTLIPAWQRYNGALYEAGRDALGDLIAAGSHVVILSGGYGVVLAKEPIGMYKAVLNLSWWPGSLLERVLITYGRRHGLTSLRTFSSATGPYPKILKRVRWREAGINDALLLTPQAESGGMRRSPASQGEALAAFRDGTLTPDWQSSYGLGIDVHSA